MMRNVDAPWRQASAIGARIVVPIAVRYYGLRDGRIADQTSSGASCSAGGAAVANPGPEAPEPPQGRLRLALLVTAVLVAAVLVLLPRTLLSLVTELLGAPVQTLYEVTPERTIVAVRPERRTQSAINANIVVAGIDEATRLATLRVSGNRACSPTCPARKLVFFAVQDDAAERRALPSSATVTLAENRALLSDTVHLPVRGQPTLYPFDTYQLWLGVAAFEEEPDGTEHPLRSDEMDRNLQVTLQEDLGRLDMAAPVWIAPDRVHADGDPVSFLYVFGLSFHRPEYLKELTVLLVVLIALSACFAVSLRPVHDLFLGIGGVILGVWGVRNMLVQGTLPYVTAVDLALLGVILLLLLAVAVRAVLHFRRLSGFRLRGPGRGP
jgi:hypothetical protein